LTVGNKCAILALNIEQMNGSTVINRRYPAVGGGFFAFRRERRVPVATMGTSDGGVHGCDWCRVLYWRCAQDGRGDVMTNRYGRKEIT